MPTANDAARALAERLRTLRKSRWPDVAVTQAELAEALGARKPTSVQLISSWERTSSPAPPPEDRLRAIATFFSTRRTLDGPRTRLIDEADLTVAEAEARDELLRELLRLRQAAVTAGSDDQVRGKPTETIVGRGLWHFEDNGPVIIVCAELPPALQEKLPFSDIADANREELLRLADLDALFELHGHIRAVNPDADVQYRSANRMRRDDWTAHLVLLGGEDWNPATRDTLRFTRIPVRQRSDGDDPRRICLQVVEADETQSFSPVFDERPGLDHIVVQDVGHLVRAPNPFNRACTVTVCNGLYGAGVLGAVRALTDKVFRDHNEGYLEDRFGLEDGFGEKETFSLLFRVQIVNGVVATPDWTAPNTVLHTWWEASRTTE